MWILALPHIYLSISMIYIMKCISNVEKTACLFYYYTPRFVQIEPYNQTFTLNTYELSPTIVVFMFFIYELSPTILISWNIAMNWTLQSEIYFKKLQIEPYNRVFLLFSYGLSPTIQKSTPKVRNWALQLELFLLKVRDWALQ